nr:(2Fe-2S)-binding protein [Hoyosella altamirensis]
MYACICAAVPREQVEATILAGARTVREIGDRCGAGKGEGCGCCRKRLARLLLEQRARATSMGNLPNTA